MAKRLLAIMGMISFVLALVIPQAQTAEHTEKIKIMREAKQDMESTVAVDGFVAGSIFKVKVSVRAEEGTPNIHSVLLVGPKIGRMSPTLIKTVYASVEEEEPYPTTTRGGFISFGNKTKTKKLKGRVARKMAEYRLEPDELKDDGEYQLWVRVENYDRRGRVRTYRFDIDIATLKDAITQ